MMIYNTLLPLFLGAGESRGTLLNPAETRDFFLSLACLGRLAAMS